MPEGNEFGANTLRKEETVRSTPDNSNLQGKMKKVRVTEGCPILTTCSGRESAFTTRTSRGTIVPLVSLVQVVR